MRTGLAMLLGAAVLVGPAKAQTPAGFYVAAGIGVNQPQNSDLTTTGGVRAALGAGNGDIRFEPQAMGVMALGYGFGNGIRVELEGSLRGNAVDRASSTAAQAPVTQSQGQVWNYGLMANALYEVDIGTEWVRPYVGVGLGYVRSEVRDFRVNGNRSRLAVDGTDNSLGYQAIIGAAFRIGAVPGLSATAEYRFMGLVDPEYGATLRSQTRRQVPTGSAEINPYHHSLLVGLRYAFGGGPEPMPVAAPVPPIQIPQPAPAFATAPVPRSYIVYFGLNSASLTVRARQIVTEAAQAARGGVTRIEVSGHTDTLGTPQSNQRLSERRAAAVANELRRQGIRAEDIAVRGHGETQLAVATGNGVAEPRNRRVEILLR